MDLISGIRNSEKECVESEKQLVGCRCLIVVVVVQYQSHENVPSPGALFLRWSRIHEPEENKKHQAYCREKGQRSERHKLSRVCCEPLNKSTVIFNVQCCLA